MRCPVCGVKVQDGVCRYCKTTMAEITTASNKEARRLRKEDRRLASDKVVYSTYIPDDVDKKKLKIFTFALGFVGANDFLVGRLLRGLFKAIVMSAFLVVTFVYVLALAQGFGSAKTIYYIAEVLSIPAAIVVYLYVQDIVCVICGKYKVPVVLGEKNGK